MADDQLVCLSLIHPPQVQLFSRIHEVLWRVLLPQMQLLGSSVDDPQIETPSLEPKQIVHHIRDVAGEGIFEMFDFIIASRNVATGYIKLLRTLPDVKESSTLVNDVHTFTFGGTRRTEDMQQYLMKVREELDSGLRRITGILADDTPSGLTESVSGILSAIDELDELFQECDDYFEEIRKQTSDGSVIESNPPTVEETQIMHEKWGMFWERLGELKDGWDDLADLIGGKQIIQADGSTRYTPEAIQEITGRPPLSIPRPTKSKLSAVLNATRPTNNSGGPGSGANPTVNPPAPSPTKAKVPFWRKIFRCSKKVDTDSANKRTGRNSADPGPSNSSPMHKSKIPFWRKLIQYSKRNNPARPTSDSESLVHPPTAAGPSTCHNPQAENE